MMNVGEQFLSSIKTSTESAISTVADHLPSVLLALLVLVIGWLLARLMRSIARKAFAGTNRLLNRLIDRRNTGEVQLSPVVASILSEILFWVVVLLAAAIAARIAELPALSGWLERIAEWLPNLLMGVAIIVIGYLASIAAGDQVSSSARKARSTQSVLIGRLTQSAIFITGIIIGLDQIGVNVTLLTGLFVVSAACILIGFSIAFGLGARDHVSNLIGARTARQRLRPGTTLRIGDIEGEVLEVTHTQIAIETEDGRALLPARLAEEREILILAPKNSGASANE